jgi:hypothetical protein
VQYRLMGDGGKGAASALVFGGKAAVVWIEPQDDRAHFSIGDGVRGSAVCVAADRRSGGDVCNGRGNLCWQQSVAAGRSGPSVGGFLCPLALCNRAHHIARIGPEKRK